MGHYTSDLKKKKGSFSKGTAFLVASDSRDTHKTVPVILTFLGFKRHLSCKSGIEAWRLLKGEQVDFMISEWCLPDMDGLLLLKFMRVDDSFDNTPVILVVEEITREKVIRAGEAGVNAIIVKPVTINVLQEKLDEIYAVFDDPKSRQAEILMEEAKEFMLANKYDEALESFEKVLTIFESAEIYYNIGFIMVSQGKYDEALAAFRKATKINATYVAAYKMMAQIYQRLGRDKEAQDAFESAAELLMNQDMFDSAERIYQEIVKINPASVNVYNTLGILSRKRGDFRTAMSYYKKALKVNPEDENIYFNIGRLHMDMKEFDEGREAFRQALLLNPNFKEAKNMIRSLDMGLSL
ncbi:MAG: tetratricopeptide repeat protein [Deltaproteobacteria bacterium]|nr:tetratricopeptide repeat protein [Deltaproteobacteria bacterium]